MKNTKKTKTKLSILGVAVIAGVLAIGSLGVFNNTNDVAVEPSTVSKPHEIPFYQGVPMLQAGIASLDQEKFHEVSVEKYPWLGRAIQNGEAIVSDREVEEFFVLSNDNYYYKVGSEMYFVNYVDANIRLDTHYVKAFPYDDAVDNAKSLDVSNVSWIQKALNDPYAWVEIPESDYNSFMDFKSTGADIRTVDGDFNLRYVGANSEELKMPENKDLVAKSTGVFENGT